MGQHVKYVVFTDASCRRAGRRSYCGYGGVILNTETEKYATFGGPLSDRTTVFCEAWGLMYGLAEVSNIIKKSGCTNVSVLLVTDSKLNVQVLTEWIPKWDLSDWMNWKKNDGSAVKNQDIYRRILRILRENPEMKVRITHVNSHLTGKEWKRMLDKLQQYGIQANETTSKTFMRMNAIADEIATSITSHMKYSDQDGIRLIRRNSDDA